MIPASGRLRQAIVDRRLTHPDDEGLNRHVSNAIARHSRRGWRIDRPGPRRARRRGDRARDGGRPRRSGRACGRATRLRLARRHPCARDVQHPHRSLDHSAPTASRVPADVAVARRRDAPQMPAAKPSKNDVTLFPSVTTATLTTTASGAGRARIRRATALVPLRWIGDHRAEDTRALRITSLLVPIAADSRTAEAAGARPACGHVPLQPYALLEQRTMVRGGGDGSVPGGRLHSHLPCRKQPLCARAERAAGRSLLYPVKPGGDHNVQPQ